MQQKGSPEKKYKKGLPPWSRGGGRYGERERENSVRGFGQTEPEGSLRALKFSRYQLTSLKQEVFSTHEAPHTCSVRYSCKQIPFKSFRLFTGTRRQHRETLS